MRSYVAALLASMLAAAVLTPSMRWVGLRVGLVSPSGSRHVHSRNIPRLGGVAIAGAFFVPLVALFLFNSVVAATVRESPNLVMGLIIGGSMVCVAGLVDDTRGLRASQKLAVQIVAASVAYACGFRITAVNLPLLGDLNMGVFALPVTVFWIVGVTNAVNLIDGLDGLAAGVAFFAAVTNFVVAYISGSVLFALLMAATMGALIGFLFYNFNPARIFMGDSGSYFLGFVLASSSLAASSKTSTAVSLLVPILALGVPIFDTLFSMFRRWLERRPLFSPDRGHIHHRLLDMGITHRRAVLVLYGVSVVFTISAIAISLGHSWEVGAVLVVVTTVAVGFVRYLGYFEHLHTRMRQRGRLYDYHTERLRRLVPGLLAAIRTVRDEAELRSLLDESLLTKFGHYEILTAEGPRPALSSSPPGLNPRDRRGYTSAKFPIGRDDNARAVIKFDWQAETEDASPHTAILLQVLVDAIEQQLARMGSDLAPGRPPVSSEDVAQAPALTVPAPRL